MTSNLYIESKALTLSVMMILTLMFVALTTTPALAIQINQGNYYDIDTNTTSASFTSAMDITCANGYDGIIQSIIATSSARTIDVQTSNLSNVIGRQWNDNTLFYLPSSTIYIASTGGRYWSLSGKTGSVGNCSFNINANSTGPYFYGSGSIPGAQIAMVESNLSRYAYVSYNDLGWMLTTQSVGDIYSNKVGINFRWDFATNVVYTLNGTTAYRQSCYDTGSIPERCANTSQPASSLYYLERLECTTSAPLNTTNNTNDVNSQGSKDYYCWYTTEPNIRGGYTLNSTQNAGLFDFFNKKFRLYIATYNASVNNVSAVTHTPNQPSEGQSVLVTWNTIVPSDSTVFWRSANIEDFNSYVANNTITSAILNASEDSYTDQTTPNTNFGTSPELQFRYNTGCAGFKYTWIKFSLSGIQNINLISSSIRVTQSNPFTCCTGSLGGGTMNMFRLSNLSCAWNENNITYNSQCSIGTSIAGILVSETGVPCSGYGTAGLNWSLSNNTPLNSFINSTLSSGYATFIILQDIGSSSEDFIYSKEGPWSPQLTLTFSVFASSFPGFSSWSSIYINESKTFHNITIPGGAIFGDRVYQYYVISGTVNDTNLGSYYNFITGASSIFTGNQTGALPQGLSNLAQSLGVSLTTAVYIFGFFILMMITIPAFAVGGHQVGIPVFIATALVETQIGFLPQILLLPIIIVTALVIIKFFRGSFG